MHEFLYTCYSICMHVMCMAVTVHAICEGLDTIVGCNVNVLVNNAQFIVLVIICSSLEVGGQT